MATNSIVSSHWEVWSVTPPFSPLDLWLLLLIEDSGSDTRQLLRWPQAKAKWFATFTLLAGRSPPWDTMLEMLPTEPAELSRVVTPTTVAHRRVQTLSWSESSSPRCASPQVCELSPFEASDTMEQTDRPGFSEFLTCGIGYWSGWFLCY